MPQIQHPSSISTTIIEELMRNFIATPPSRAPIPPPLSLGLSNLYYSNGSISVEKKEYDSALDKESWIGGLGRKGKGGEEDEKKMS